MSTNKTPNYQLHSWLGSDEFHVTEINENFSALDGKLKEEVSTLDRLLKAETAARTQGLSKRPEVVFGIYKGTSQPHHIDLGRAATMVHISIDDGSDGGLFQGTSGSKYDVTVDETGFTLNKTNLNDFTRYYCYAAFFL